MRIVGGSLRGRKLATPKNDAIRPTTDRNRESLFNILVHRWPDHLQGRVLDCFAGTGALGLEALSRGATFCAFIEKSSQGLSLINGNINTLSLQACSQVVRRDAIKPCEVVATGPFDLIFADPPYGRGLGEKAVAALMAENWIAKDAVLVLEEKTGALPHDLDGFELDDERVLGETTIGIYRRTRLR